MLKIIQNLWNDIRRGENIDLYLTAFVAITLAILNLFGIGATWTGSITLSVLALLAVSTLVNRQKLERAIERLGASKDDIFLDRYPSEFIGELKSSKELWIVGINLRRTLTTYYALLEDKLRKGHTIRVLVVDPDGVASDLLASQSSIIMAPEEHRALIRLSLSNLCSLKSLAPNKLEIRTINQPMPNGFFAINLSKTGLIYVKTYPFRMEDDIPIIVFRQNDGRWYEFYKKQILTLWNNSVEWTCINKG